LQLVTRRAQLFLARDQSYSTPRDRGFVAHRAVSLLEGRVNVLAQQPFLGTDVRVVAFTAGALFHTKLAVSLPQLRALDVMTGGAGGLEDDVAVVVLGPMPVMADLTVPLGDGLVWDPASQTLS
jgi:hypothetical protein